MANYNCTLSQLLNTSPPVSLALSLLAMLDDARIALLLQPFLGDTPVSAELAGRLHTYLELLLRWNARINLTAVRDPEQIVTRHFGESLFAARVLRDAGAFTATPTLSDIGSGAGFPGIPIKLFVPGIHLTLIESHNKKATFLREVIRTLALPGTDVFCGRADAWNRTATVVTLRAVDKFEGVLPIVGELVASGGILSLLIGASQVPLVRNHLSQRWQFGDPVPIPLSEGRVVVMGRRSTESL